MVHNPPRRNPETQKPLANAVYRSRIEICRILQELVSSGSPVFAEIGVDRLLTTKILHVDDEAGYLVVEYGSNKWLNTALFDHPALRYRASYMEAHLFFQLFRPIEHLLGDKPAIRFTLPESLLWSQRREHQRIVVPPHVPLHCVYKNENGEFFKANVYDISLGGLGGMIFEENVALRVGAVLKGCRVTCPGFEPVVVDLMVRDIMSIARTDGSIYKRVGVRFIQRPEEIRVLVDHFIHDLGS
jgi:c-di-GMP-binding flagellar brake protein YcgR